MLQNYQRFWYRINFLDSSQSISIFYREMENKTTIAELHRHDLSS
jgi:hypothetical protein